VAADPTLRHLFPKDDGAPNTLDASAIIRRSRARRLPKRLAVGSVTTLAVAGIVIASVQGVGVVGQPAAQVAQSEASSEDLSSASKTATPLSIQGQSAGQEASQFAAGTGQLDEATVPPDSSADYPFAYTATSDSRSAATINACGGTLGQVPVNDAGLTVSLDFPRVATLSGNAIAGTVTVTNTGDSAVVGTAGTNAVVALSKNNTVLWYTNEPIINTALNEPSRFEPGATRSYKASFWPVTCSPGDSATVRDANGRAYVEAFGRGLPTVTPGDYDLSAFVDFDTNSDVDILGSPLTTITLK